MSGLPTGTVTLLFTDIEGSTRLLHELGDLYPRSLADHRRIIRKAVANHEGHEVDTQGDAFIVAFASTSAAVAAAVTVQRDLAAQVWADGMPLRVRIGMPLRVRIGLHTGEPTVTDEGYVGIDLHRAPSQAILGVVDSVRTNRHLSP